MNVEFYKNAFYKLTKINDPEITRWIKEEIPFDYRFYQEGAWYVHKKYLDDIYRLVGSSKAPTTPSMAADYAVFHLLPSAPSAIVDASFRLLAKIAHPDSGGDSEEFKRLNAAYQRIKDNNK